MLACCLLSSSSPEFHTNAHRFSVLQCSNRKFTKFIRLLMNNSAVKHIFPLFACRKAFGGCVHVCAQLHAGNFQLSFFFLFFQSNFTLCAHVLYHSDGKEKTTTTKTSQVVLGRQKGVTVGGVLSIKLFQILPRAPESRSLHPCVVVLLRRGRFHVPYVRTSSTCRLPQAPPPPEVWRSPLRLISALNCSQES